MVDEDRPDLFLEELVRRSRAGVARGGNEGEREKRRQSAG
jgi:hypothetical protein